jgi:ribokinase
VAGEGLAFFPGGKGANQAVAAARLGAHTALVGRIGEDAFGRDLRAFLSTQAIDLRDLQDTARAPTGTALITLAGTENTIVVVPGANGLLSEADVAAPILAPDDVLVAQFEVPVPTVRAFFTRGRAAGARTILNPAPARRIDYDLLALVDVLILNETELSLLAGARVGDGDLPAAGIAAARALQSHERQTVCVTCGKQGVAALIGNDVLLVPGRAVEAVDTTGAGDCFVGAVAARLVASDPLERAFAYANVAASICVQRMGAGPSMPAAHEVAAVLGAE